MRRVLTLVVGTLLCVAMPRAAAADILLTPFAGVSFVDENTKKMTYGATLSLGGLIGFEGELARTSLAEASLRGTPIDLNAHVTTGMVNVVARFPTGPLQPYATAGLGVIRATGSADVPALGPALSISGRTFGMNYGGGLYVFPSKSIGIRGDIRYFRTVGDLTLKGAADLFDIDLPVPDFDFWRITGGVTLRF
ncbi:MAG: outer membrane beta-barrel protein [Acidobacteria bacterium]|nr:outer membrane beta-barrel protein [Acidobacteriota bacterium]